jgi:hypothetical protein
MACSWVNWKRQTLGYFSGSNFESVDKSEIESFLIFADLGPLQGLILQAKFECLMSALRLLEKISEEEVIRLTTAFDFY